MIKSVDSRSLSSRAIKYVNMWKAKIIQKNRNLGKGELL